MPIKITTIQKASSVEDLNLEAFWISSTKLTAPEYCSVLRCIERKITYCKVRRNDDHQSGIIPLCQIHSEQNCVSETYDYHLAPCPNNFVIP